MRLNSGDSCYSKSNVISAADDTNSSLLLLVGLHMAMVWTTIWSGFAIAASVTQMSCVSYNQCVVF